jgi:hypothetical protein
LMPHVSLVLMVLSKFRNHSYFLFSDGIAFACVLKFCGFKVLFVKHIQGIL